MHKKNILLGAISLIIFTSLLALVTWFFYQSSIDKTYQKLSIIAKNQKHLIESVAQFDARNNTQDEQRNSLEATLSQVRQAYARSDGKFGQSGGFVIGWREKDKLALLRQKLDTALEIKEENEIAKPMQLALTGKSGTTVSKDYLGEVVLTAYESVDFPNQRFGIVAKIDLKEVREPFIQIIVIISGFLVLLIATVIYIYNRQNEQRSAPTTGNERPFKLKGWATPQVISVLFIGIIISGAISQVYYDLLITEKRYEFQKHVNVKVSQIHNEIEKNLSTIKHLKAFYYSSENVSKEEFKMYTHSVMNMDGSFDNFEMQAIGWLPKLSQNERETFELNAINDGIENFTVKDLKDGTFISAKPRDTYYPVYYIEPFTRNKMRLGFDLGSDPELLKVLNRARDNGQLDASLPFNLINQKEAGKSFLAAIAIYQGDPKTDRERTNALQGFIVGLLGINHIINDANMNVESNQVELNIYDKSTKIKIPVFSSTDNLDILHEFKNNNSPFYLEKELLISGRQWVVEAYPSKEFITILNDYQNIILVFIMGLIYTFLIALQFRNATIKQANIEQMISRRTLELKDSQERFLSYMKYSPVLTSITDYNDKFVFANESWQKYFNINNDEFLGKTLQEVLPIKVASEFSRKNHSLLKSTKLIDSDVWKDGNKASFLTYRFLINRDQQTPLIGTSYIDISTQMGLEDELRQINGELELRVTERTEELHQKQKRLQGIVEHAADGIIVFDEASIIEEFSPAAELIFGYDKNEVIGKNITLLLPDSYHNGHEQFMSDLINTKKDNIKTNRQELLGEHKTGITFPIEFTVSVTEIEGKKSFIGMTRDITEQKIIENEIIKAKEDAETANSAKSAFLATMSHELRTPMNGIIGIMDVLWESDLNIEQRRLIKTSKESAFSLLRILNDILDFSKIEAGKMELESIDIELIELIENVTLNLLPSADTKDVRFNLFISPCTPDNLLGDSTRIRQIIFNLCGNAIKFTSKKDTGGQVELKVEYQGLHDLQHMIKFSIIDNGIGMSEEHMTQLFQPFTQAEQSTTRRYGGTGLGLSITRNITELLEGDITVESTLGEGSTFSVTLPFIANENTEGEVLTNMQSLNLVLASRDTYTKELLQHYIELSGGEVSFIDDLDMAYQKVQVETELILIIGSEYESTKVTSLIERVRSSEYNENIKFILLSNDRGTDFGLILPNIYVIQDRPILLTHFLRSIAILSGQISPEILDQYNEKVKEKLIPLTSEEAIENNSLVLFVEDNEVNREVLQLQLNQLGYTVEMACNGKEGLDLWMSGRYALVLTDYHMPEMDGIEMTAAIRQYEQEQHLAATTIIAVTANALAGEARRFLDQGMNDYISKPVELKLLKKLMSKWLPLGKKEEDTSEDHNLNFEEDNNIPVDFNILTQLVGDDQAIHQRLLDKYISNATETVQQINDALTNQDIEELCSLGHKFKSSSRSVGAVNLGNICELLESKKQCDNFVEIEKVITDLRTEWEIVKTYIQQKA